MFNKTDRFEDKETPDALCRCFNAVAVCALDKTSLRGLLEKIEAALPGTDFSGQGNYVSEE